MSERFGPDVKLNTPAFIHETALIYGAVRIESGASLWPYSVVRAESGHALIGEMTNIQDFVMIHTSPGRPTIIGKNCSITHHCTIHAAHIGDNCLIGINSTLYDGCVIGNNCIIGQHTYVKEGMKIPDNSIVVGSPARIVGTRDNRLPNIINARLYHHNALAYAKGEHRAWSGPGFAKLLDSEVKQIQKEIEDGLHG